MLLVNWGEGGLDGNCRRIGPPTDFITRINLNVVLGSQRNTHGCGFGIERLKHPYTAAKQVPHTTLTIMINFISLQRRLPPVFSVPLDRDRRGLWDEACGAHPSGYSE
jgi:hypothetical protein